ncbi:MAG: M16 family metallopeptidase, partial [Vicinamibacterales bacterium]
EARRLVEKWFSDVPAGAGVEPASIPGVALHDVQRQTITDRVQLPRLFIAWLTPPVYAPGDAALDVLSEVLSGGRNSRLYKRLVYDMQIAQSVSAVQYSGALSSFFLIDVMPQPGHTLDEVQAVVDEEIARLQREGPTDYEIQRALNQIESSFYRSMESVGGFSGKADQLNGYFVATGDPDWFNEDLARFRALSASDVQATARAFLPASKRVELRIEPEGQ